MVKASMSTSVTVFHFHLSTKVHRAVPGTVYVLTKDQRTQIQQVNTTANPQGSSGLGRHPFHA